MKATFTTLFKQLLTAATVFDGESAMLKNELLANLNKQVLSKGEDLMAYSEALLFICSHPQNQAQLKLVEKELQRITAFLKQKSTGQQKIYEDSGLPYASILTRFSHDLLEWMLQQKQYRIQTDSFSEEGIGLNEILKLTLPALERERTATGDTGTELLNALKIKPQQQLAFLIQEFSKLNDQPYLKDQLFDSLNYYVKVDSSDKKLSKFYNRLNTGPVFYQGLILKQFDTEALLNKTLPAASYLNELQNDELIACIKNSLILKNRETDPSTYIDSSSLRLFELERGISVAIYGMVPNRQLPVESYIGYTLFKNGFPAAYGGSWIFGTQALFGMNVFETYRGGESAYMMCQLLRVYRQAFSVNYFEIEPYQFGKDNPDGIASGAYWFYYRLGFRSVDQEQVVLAEKESFKIKSKKGYRSSPHVLKHLAESYVALDLGEHSSHTVSGISQQVTTLIDKKFKGNRLEAEKEVIRSFKEKTHLNIPLTTEENGALKEIAFIAGALSINSESQLKLLKEMIFAKPKDVYAYQALMRQFLRLI